MSSVNSLIASFPTFKAGNFSRRYFNPVKYELSGFCWVILFALSPFSRHGLVFGWFDVLLVKAPLGQLGLPLLLSEIRSDMH